MAEVSALVLRPKKGIDNNTGLNYVSQMQVVLVETVNVKIHNACFSRHLNQYYKVHVQ